MWFGAETANPFQYMKKQAYSFVVIGLFVP
jgi:hypothetical protein